VDLLELLHDSESKQVSEAAKSQAAKTEVLPPLPPPEDLPQSLQHSLQQQQNVHDVTADALILACESGSPDDALMHLHHLDALDASELPSKVKELLSNGSTLASTVVERASRDASFVYVAMKVLLLHCVDVDVALGPGKRLPRECAAAANLHELSELIEVKSRFCEYDVDHSGTISLDELRACMQTLDRHFDEDEIVFYLHKFDANHDGVLQFSEFLHFYDHLPM
jgi:hypothetical protein